MDGAGASPTGPTAPMTSGSTGAPGPATSSVSRRKPGRPCADFGPDGSGMVDTMVGLPRADRADRDYLNAMLWGIFSAPIVVRDKVIHGSQVADRRITKEAVPGWVRAWDVRTANTRGTFIPSRMAPTNSALRPGSTTRGATPGMRTSGGCSGEITSSGMCTCRPGQPRTTSSGPTGLGTTSFRRR